jgi:hypothetical protein
MGFHVTSTVCYSMYTVGQDVYEMKPGRGDAMDGRPRRGMHSRQKNIVALFLPMLAFTKQQAAVAVGVGLFFIGPNVHTPRTCCDSTPKLRF